MWTAPNTLTGKRRWTAVAHSSCIRLFKKPKWL